MILKKLNNKLNPEEGQNINILGNINLLNIIQHSASTLVFYIPTLIVLIILYYYTYLVKIPLNFHKDIFISCVLEDLKNDIQDTLFIRILTNTWCDIKIFLKLTYAYTSCMISGSPKGERITESFKNDIQDIIIDITNWIDWFIINFVSGNLFYLFLLTKIFLIILSSRLLVPILIDYINFNKIKLTSISIVPFFFTIMLFL